ncbi:terminase large subunit domain-containing protein [Thioclava sp.]|uniref:terminase large subunit domain-containing protein n=1 Tax=Thioclava sp. TaxID=1933450 RepID=UPI003AA7C2DE
MPFDALHDFCTLVERDLDPEAEMLHFLRQEIPNATEIDPWQLEAVNSTAGTIAMRVCRQAGKSCVLATRAVRRLKLGHTVLCLAPAERQTREISRKVATYLRATDLRVERATQTEIETSNGGRFIAVPASGATIRGYSVHEIQIDEAAYLPGQNGGEDVIVSVLPMLRDDGTSQVVFASTPAGKNNHFAELFLAPKEDVRRIVVKGTSIPRLASRVERLRSQLSATRFRQEVEVEMLSDGQSYFDLSTIEQATSQEGAICPRF